jgi:hypothetical protein
MFNMLELDIHSVRCNAKGFDGIFIAGFGQARE